jgi:hypothetical protein
MGRLISTWIAVCRSLFRTEFQTQRFVDRHGPCHQAEREGRRIPLFLFYFLGF